MLIALAAVYDLENHQMYVKIAFLNGELEEEIYIEQPEGFVVLENENKVCRLIKSLYGLKQAPKQWHAKFDQTMLANMFKINECDKCVYIKDTLNHQVIVFLYVDDMLIISRDIFDINATKRMLESKFDMKDLGVADVILESEFIALDKTGEKAEWIRNFLEDIPYCPKPVEAHSSLAQNLPLDIVLAHNNARAQVGVPLPPLTWNDTVAAYANQYASTRLAECTLVHSDSPYGENLAMGYDDFSAVEAVNMWVGEKPNYDCDSNSCKQDMCGHYTQVIWQNTLQVGRARLKCDNGEAWFVSCTYFPPGNYDGENLID
ncbi:Pathogenesis-related protein 1A [Capsicum annuum]|uniref:Pathogenesis-related protein 1A n=1 Tax=Capsicum annuum TaxID=4072 RepID=A0A2G2XJ78_CAPAN|nr:Pathogenesis-related protein 1A [Capsicum annuum]